MHAHAPLAERQAPRVRVGPATDEAEREADRIAEAVVAPAKPGCTACAAGAEPCPACAAGARKLRRSALGPAPATASPVLRGPGAPLPAATRAKFERRLGADLSAIRLHAGAEAAQAARQVHARAFALGRDIALGEPAPAPHTAEGERLLAHEVAHTLQDGAGHTLRRRTDFDIIGLHPGAGSDPGTIYFNRDSAEIDPGEQWKFTGLATPPSQALTLFGYSSEEGDPAYNAGLIDRRLRRVSRELYDTGHRAARTLTPELAASEGQAAYRERRAVSVVPTPSGGAPAVPPLGGGGPCTVAIGCGTSFTSAHPLAVAQLTTAIAQVAVGTPAARAQLAAMFPGVPQPTVLAGLTGLLSELARMPANHRCHDYPCDAACSRPAYADPAARVMTLCPAFINGGSVAENAALLLHEGLHMVPGLTTQDTAYRQSRMIDAISGAQARTNTDSYVVLILRLSGGTAQMPPADPLASLAPPEQTAARRALAFTEQWLLQADWDSSLLYEAIKRNKGRGGGWDPADAYHAGTLHAVAATFGLTDPGAAPFAATPVDADQWAVAGIHDRYNRMMAAVWMRPITVASSAAGPEAWAAGLGNAVSVTPGFFALAPPDQVLRLIELMAGSLPTADVPAARRRDYAVGAQQIWTHSGRSGP
jgi:outer membrane protein OmpA-like peptidoglycan-associated protein